MRKPVRLYFKAEPEIKTIKELTYVQRDILCLIAAFKDRGLRVLNPDISEGLLLSESYVGKVINRLEKAGYIKIKKAQSPHRVLYWSEKTKALLCTTVLSKNEATLHPSAKLLNPPVQCTQHPSAECIVSKEVNEVKKDNEPVLANNSLPKDSTQTTQENTFEIFWQWYPKKVSRKEALKSWQKLSPDQRLFDEIMLALEKHKAQESWHKENGRFIPNPSTWLNAERWTDEVANPQAEPDYSAALDKYTRDVSEEEADELMRTIQDDSR